MARAFRPSVDVLPELVAFAAEAFAQQGMDRALLPPIDFVLEELFTNVVKYGRTAADVVVELGAVPGGVQGCVIADGVDRYDITQAPTRDTTLPLAQRRPGGLGLQLTRQCVDTIEYEYQDTLRRSRITFRKTRP